MPDSDETPVSRFAALRHALASEPAVDPESAASSARAFGATALKTSGKIFAMLTNDRFVVKLPKDRVAHFVATGMGVHLETTSGRPMREWLSLNPSTELDWDELAREALAFVGASAKSKV